MVSNGSAMYVVRKSYLILKEQTVRIVRHMEKLPNTQLMMRKPIAFEYHDYIHVIEPYPQYVLSTNIDIQRLKSHEAFLPTYSSYNIKGG